MKNPKNALIVAVVIALIAVSGVGSYFLGLSNGAKQNNLEVTALKNELKDTKEQLDLARSDADAYLTNFQASKTDNERLVNDYNKLVEQANAALRTSTYNPISCTSNTVGLSVYTNCY